MAKYKDIDDLIDQRTKKTKNFCHIWQGGTTNHGVPITAWNGKPMGVISAIFYEKGDSRAGYQTKITCGNKLCVNPDHYELLYKEVKWDYHRGKVRVEGQLLDVSEIIEKTGLTIHGVRWRVENGWTADEIMGRTQRETKPKSPSLPKPFKWKGPIQAKFDFMKKPKEG